MKDKDTLSLKKLNNAQLEKLYNEHIIYDFPRNERKPLDMIQKSIEDGYYETFGLFEGNTLVGYTFFVRKDNNYLIDYIATFPECRNRGLGAGLISLIDQALEGADRVLGEVEDPAYAQNPEDRELQTRRLNFYKRNGCRDTGLRVSCFEVPYIILEPGEGASASLEETYQLYESFYRMFLPGEKVDRSIRRIFE